MRISIISPLVVAHVCCRRRLPTRLSYFCEYFIASMYKPDSYFEAILRDARAINQRHSASRLNGRVVFRDAFRRCESLLAAGRCFAIDKILHA